MEKICIITETLVGKAPANKYIIGYDPERCPDLKAAIEAAAADYIGTLKEEKHLFWHRFWSDCPDVICRKYGFWKLETETLIIDGPTPVAGKGTCPFPYGKWDRLANTLAGQNALVLSVLFATLPDPVLPGQQEAVTAVIEAEGKRAKREALEQLRPYLPIEFLKDQYRKRVEVKEREEL